MSETITTYVPRPSHLEDVRLTYTNKVEPDADRNVINQTNPALQSPYNLGDYIPCDNPIQEDFPLPPEVVDMVNHPSHYALEKYECKEVLKEVLKDLDGYEGFCIGNVVKYCWRLKRKGKPVEDAEKAAFYINDCIEYMKAKEESKDVSLP